MGIPQRSKAQAPQSGARSEPKASGVHEQAATGLGTASGFGAGRDLQARNAMQRRPSHARRDPRRPRPQLGADLLFSAAFLRRVAAAPAPSRGGGCGVRG
jgi:hypothetical protein